MSRTSVLTWAYPIFLVIAVGTLLIGSTVYFVSGSDAAIAITQFALAITLLVTGVHDWEQPTNRVSRPSAALRVAAGSAFLIVSALVWLL